MANNTARITGQTARPARVNGSSACGKKLPGGDDGVSPGGVVGTVVEGFPVGTVVGETGPPLLVGFRVGDDGDVGEGDPGS